MCYYSTQHSSSAGMNSTKNSSRGCVCNERQLRRHFQLLNWRGKKRAGAFLRRVREYFSRSSRGRDRIDSSHRHSVCPERDKVMFLLQSTSALQQTEPFLILGETSSGIQGCIVKSLNYQNGWFSGGDENQSGGKESFERVKKRFKAFNFYTSTYKAMQIQKYNQFVTSSFFRRGSL